MLNFVSKNLVNSLSTSGGGNLRKFFLNFYKIPKIRHLNKIE